MSLYIGTSGWSYSEWKGEFYPQKIKTAEWLNYYSKVFKCTEINTSFYHLPKQQTILNWINKVDSSFKFCPKLSRSITHIKRLKDIDEPLEQFFEVFEPAKQQLGPILIQLPPSLKFDHEIVNDFLKLLTKSYKGYKFALEARNASWISNEAFDLLTKYKIAWVISQSGVGFPYSETVTAKHIYVRFHGPEKLFDSSYDDTTLRAYAGKIKQWLKEKHDVWVFFNNTMNGHAIGNIETLQKMLKD